jgi:hypothetical protein
MTLTKDEIVGSWAKAGCLMSSAVYSYRRTTLNGAERIGSIVGRLKQTAA